MSEVPLYTEVAQRRFTTLAVLRQVQGYLAQKKPTPPRSLQYTYA